MDKQGEFPKYLMKIDGQRRFLTFHEAAADYDSGSHQVEFGCYVLDADFSVREMTQEDREGISRAADDHSSSK